MAIADPKTIPIMIMQSVVYHWPFEDMFHAPLLMQSITIMFVFEIYVLLIIAESSSSHSKWKKAISKYHDRLFDIEYESDRNENEID